MELNVEAVGGVAVVEIMADVIDASVADDVKGRLSDLASEHRNVVVDLHRVKFLDSSGCGALVAAQTRFRTVGGELRLCCPTPAVKTLLELVRLNRVLSLYDTRDAATGSFGKD
jgi:anti-sigma B factor antagonist